MRGKLSRNLRLVASVIEFGMRAMTSYVVALALMVACSGGEGDSPPLASPEAAPGLPPVQTGPPEVPPGTLVIPSDEPSWNQLHGLLDNPGLYGEADWDDVRMRVIGHVATIGRDRARASAGRKDLAGCAEAYRDTAARILAISSASVTGAPIRKALSDAATRDAALCDALARGEAPADPGSGIAHIRARWHALALSAAKGKNVAVDATALAAEARAIVVPALTIDDFDDFEARHALRVKLVEAYADAVDPLRVAEPWGYWGAAEFGRVAETLAKASEALGAASVSRRKLPGPDALVPAVAVVAFTVAGVGALPTGDSLVDVVGFPGPKAIGTLAKLSLDDPEHRLWVVAETATLEAAKPAAVPDLVAAIVTTLDGRPYGSRYYNIKQVRNAAVRVLASRGAYAEARTVLLTNWPLHHQDWACPNRAAILRAIEGRLLVAAGSREADDVLTTAMSEADTFLAHVADREKNAPTLGAGDASANGPPGGPGAGGSGASGLQASGGVWPAGAGAAGAGGTGVGPPGQDGGPGAVGPRGPPPGAPGGPPMAGGR